MKAELLAPAGSYEALTAALAAGADAVYLGGAAFGARAYAKNLTEEEILRGIDYAHLHGKKLYLTVNTLFKEEELEEQLYPFLLPYYRQGLDAVIMQDLGAVQAVRQWFPELPIHASTQMTVTGSAAARMLERQGLSRVVPARELSLSEINRIHRTTGLEIECFVHGALCYCYSGQCLMSSLIGGRSGNRGRCAQPCRLPYEVYEKGKRLGERGEDFVLSPKDMCTVEILPEILKAGVTSLKIEGRMKKPEYTAGVVSVYRKYLDLYEQDPGRYRVLSEDRKKLFDLYNRDGFNQSYYRVRNGREMIALKNEKQVIGSRRGQRNEQLFYEIQRDYLGKELVLPVSGYLTLCEGMPAALTAYAGEICVTAEKGNVEKAQKQPLTEERIRAQMKKTGNTDFYFESLEIYMDEEIFLPVQLLNDLRRETLELLKKELLAPFRRTGDFCGQADSNAHEKTQDNVWRKKETKIYGASLESGDTIGMNEPDEIKVTALAETGNQLKALLGIPGISGIYVDMFCFSKEYYQEEALTALCEAKAEGKQLMLALPHAVRDGELERWREDFRKLAEEGLAGFLVRNLESLAFLSEIGLARLAVADYSLYTMNCRAQEFFRMMGVKRDTVPLELNRQELGKRYNGSSEMIVYGYLPMMISAQCVKKTMDKCNHKKAMLRLKDRYGKEFPVKCCCDLCYNVIYNSLPLGLLAEAEAVRTLKPCSVRLAFTFEGAEETKQTAEKFLAVYMQHMDREPDREYTRGHFRRKVE